MSTTNHNGASREALTDRHKEAVKGWVPKVRRILEEEFEAQLDRLGLKPSGKHTPVEKMRLPEDATRVRRRVEALLARDRIAEGTAERGFDNVKRELAYTVLNRLVGLKAMEARALLYLPPPKDPRATPEPTEVLTPVPGQAYSRYLRDFRAAGGSRYKYDDDAEEALLRDGLTAAFRHITGEIGVLFDPDHEYACVWPTHGTLTRVIRTINEDLPDDAYRARDFLGWVYQFFNRDEKKRVRDENKGTPRSSYELAVINQFYTPSWVVKALVDNTLGRLWLQMHPDSSLAATAPPPLPDERPVDLVVADYLVPRTGERIRYQRLDDAGQVQAFKRARDIALLDPACGTMHFGQYAFGLFHRMYLDEIEHAGEAGWPDEPSVKEPRAIPAAILEHNLFGIDIDPRAIQISSLSLMLTAKEAALQHGFSPLDVRVRRTNLVVANAVDLGQERLRALVQRVGKRNGTGELRERLFAAVWDNLQYVSELGSLVQVRESVAQVLDAWVDARAREKGLTKLLGRRAGGQLDLGTILTDSERGRAHQLELERKVLEDEARELAAELLGAIETAAAQATEDPSDRIFAEDTARGLKLLQLLSRKYDVVVMNPPYGSTTSETRHIVDGLYPEGRNDIYCAFVLRGLSLVHRQGYVGALTSRGFFTGPRPKDFRAALLGRPHTLVFLADLGAGILDGATVNTAAYVVAPGGAVAPNEFVIHDLEVEHQVRESTFVSILNGREEDRAFRHTHGFFLEIPDGRLAYHLLDSMSYAFKAFRPLFPEYLEDSACVGRSGFSPSRCAIIQGPIPVPLDWFTRFHWELRAPHAPGWLPFVKGGEFDRFYFAERLVLDWRESGRRAKNYAKERYGSESRTIKNDRYFGLSGLTYPRVSSIGFSCREYPKDYAFTDSGPVLIFKSRDLEQVAFAVLNSSLAMVTLWQFNKSRKTEINDLALFPLPARIPPEAVQLAARSKELKQVWAGGCERNRHFERPYVLWEEGSIPDRLKSLESREATLDSELNQNLARLDQVVFEEYRISEDDRRRVLERAAEAPTDVVWSEYRGKTVEQKRMEHVFRLLSYAVKRVVEADDDGIVPFAPVAGEPSLADRVHRELQALFPKLDIGQVEVEIANELKKNVKGYRKTSGIAEWLKNAFFEFHCSLYKSRPIFWHIASSQGTGPFAFGALVHYHRFDKNRMAQLRAQYLRDAIETFRREAALADKAGRTDARQDWQARLEEAQELDRRLQWVQEGRHEGPEGGDHDYRILTPWKAPEDRPKGWAPDLDDGVKVNIEPVQKAGVLRVAKVVG